MDWAAGLSRSSIKHIKKSEVCSNRLLLFDSLPNFLTSLHVREFPKSSHCFWFLPFRISVAPSGHSHKITNKAKTRKQHYGATVWNKTRNNSKEDPHIASSKICWLRLFCSLSGTKSATWFMMHTQILKMHYRRPDFINQTTQPISFSVEPQYSQQWCVRAHLLCERSNKFLRRWQIICRLIIIAADCRPPRCDRQIIAPLILFQINMPLC